MPPLGRSSIILEGSLVRHRPGAVRTASVRDDRVLQVTVVLRPGAPPHYPGYAGHPALFVPWAAAELGRRFDPGAAAFAKVAAFARRHGLRMVGRSKARHDVVLEGPVGSLEKAFGVTLHHFVHEGGRYHAHEDPIRIPAELTGTVDGVLGLDSVPLHSPHATATVAGTGRVFTPAQLAERYRFPKQDASGLTIGILEFGGGYHRADLELFAQRLGLTLPKITDVEIVGGGGARGRNAPPSPDEMKSVARVWQKATTFAQVAAREAFMNSLEVTMDIEIAAALGGGADIAVFFAPQGADGWRRALYTVMGHHYPGQTGPAPAPPAVLSVSWGESESEFGPMKLKMIHDALAAAQASGITIVCSSGDRGSSNGFAPSTVANVNFPASSPAVLACGGTTVSLDERLPETAWNGRFFDVPMATGGGMSGYFPAPLHQQSLATPSSTGTWLADGNGEDFAGRWLPDVAAHAAFENGLRIVVGGADLVGGGTSAATPLWASLLVRLQAAAGHPLAGVASWLYARAPGKGCTDVTAGNNDVSSGAIRSYRASAGWDPCSGLGVPDGVALLDRLAETAPPPAAAARATVQRPKQRAKGGA